jgi:hypothetical protein
MSVRSSVHKFHLLFQELKSMNTNQNITIGINFEQIPILRVKPQASEK